MPLTIERKVIIKIIVWEVAVFLFLVLYKVANPTPPPR
jgi:hypothetical protein